MYLLVVDQPTGPLTRVGQQLVERFGWVVGFADSGAECFTHLASQRWDAVLTARQMHDIDGLSLLTLVKTKQPSAVRLLVDPHAHGSADGSVTGRTSIGQRAETAHRIIEDAPSAASIRAILTTLKASPLGMPEELQKAIGTVSGLPAVHRILMELREVVVDPGTGVSDITDVIADEPSLTAKVLHLANAGFARQTIVISDLNQAAALLGMQTLQQVVIASIAFSAVAAMDVDPTLVEQAQRHGAAASRMAAGMPGMPAHARTGALLLDIGLPLMALAWPRRHAMMRDESRGQNRPLHEIEREQVGVTHAEAGALLARRWSLPQELAQMIEGHHLPPLSERSDPRSTGFQVHHAVQTSSDGNGLDTFDVTTDSNLPAWV